MSSTERARHPARPRLLVVDDQPVIQELVAEVMSDYDTVGVLTGEAAIELIAGGAEFDVALIDKNLPGRSGLEVIRELRRHRPELEIILITAYPSFDSALEAIGLGAFDYLVKPMRDISDLRIKLGNAYEKVRQRRAERVLREELAAGERRYRQLFEASPDAVLVFDAAARIVVDANGAAVGLFGWSREQLIGREVESLIDADTGRARRRDGATIAIEVTRAVLDDGARQVVLAVARDISERERAEAHRRSLEQRLQAAQKLEALGQLAAGVAHDFANLLGIIRTHGELVAEALGETDAEVVATAREDLANIDQAAGSGRLLTRQLLAFSGLQPVEARTVDLVEVVRATVRMIKRALGKQIEIALEGELGPLLVRADPGHLEQIVTNLAINARDAMADRGRLTFAMHRTPDGAEVMLEVRDTGSGIPDAIRDRIFDPFFTTKPSERGTGLGLATVHALVTQAGGRIDLRSEVGVGTAFEIYLPISEAEASDLDITPRRSRPYKVAVAS